LRLCGGLITVWVERTVVGAQGAKFDLPRAAPPAGRAGDLVYLGKLAWPTDLMFIYPRWNVPAKQRDGTAGWVARSR